jgi:hypothetical protein
MISYVFVIVSLAVDPSLHTSGDLAPVHVGLVSSEQAGGVPVAATSAPLIVQTSGFKPPAHVGKVPSAHVAAPLT